MINIYGEDRFYISDNESLIIVYNEKNNIFWNETYFECNGERIFIGSYFKGKELVDWNKFYIAIFTRKKEDDGSYTPIFKKIFDIRNRVLIHGSSEELLDYYNNVITVPSDERKI